jgi:hypothetical protein
VGQTREQKPAEKQVEEKQWLTKENEKKWGMEI